MIKWSIRYYLNEGEGHEEEIPHIFMNDIPCIPITEDMSEGLVHTCNLTDFVLINLKTEPEIMRPFYREIKRHFRRKSV